MNRKLAFARKAVPVSVALGAATVAAFFALMSTSHTVADPQPGHEMTARDYAINAQAAMHRIGLSPEAMAVAGLDGPQARQCLDLMSVYLAQSGNAARLRDRTRALNQGLNELSKGVEVNTEGVLVRPDIAALRSNLDSTLDEMFAFVTAGLSADQLDRLHLLHERKDLGLPIQYLVGADRTGDEWMQIRAAIAAQRAAHRRGATLADATHSHLTAVEGDTEILAASQRLADDLPAINQAWQSHLDAN